MTVLVTTHYMDEAEQCDRLAFILDGRIIASGSPTGAEGARSTTASSRSRLRTEPFAALASVRGDASLEDAYLFGLRLRAVAREGGAEAAARLLSRYGSPAPAAPSLEDVFVSLARKRPRARGGGLTEERCSAFSPSSARSSSSSPGHDHAAHDRHGPACSRR